MINKPLKFTFKDEHPMTKERLLEIAGIDYTRPLNDQDVMNDRNTKPEHKPSWDDGQDAFNPDVQDVQDSHRQELLKSLDQALAGLQGLDTFLATVDSTVTPQYTNLENQVTALKGTIDEIMNGASFPPVESPKNNGGGTKGLSSARGES